MKEVLNEHLSFTILKKFSTLFLENTQLKKNSFSFSQLLRQEHVGGLHPFFKEKKCIKRFLLLFTVTLSLLRLGWATEPSAAAISKKIKYII